ncbi:MAG: glutamate formimidoyltransferase [Planctomycetes bacterium]|nr:glutamate formimidoyltransferase [Planctomycetota bacterium]
MKTVIECVPNISEGRDKDKIQILTQIFNKFTKIKLLDVDSDADHNRTVITFISNDKIQLNECCMALIGECRKLFNIEKHLGVHPRIGIADIIPFIPLKGVTINETVALAREIAKSVSEQYKIPAYLYGHAALKPEYKNLSNFRNFGYEKLKSYVENEKKFLPDFGPLLFDKKLGAVAIGVRDILIAFNINLATTDVYIATKIASLIRGQNNGLKGVKALGFYLDSKKCAQVSMNVCDYQATPLDKIFCTVQEYAKNLGTSILNSEIVGLAPKDALTRINKEKIKLTKAKLLDIK